MGQKVSYNTDQSVGMVDYPIPREVFEAICKILHHGHGNVEIVILDHKVSHINKKETIKPNY